MIRDVRDARAYAFWILPPLLAVVVTGAYMLLRSEGPMGERVLSIVVFVVLAALVQTLLYRSNRARSRTAARSADRSCSA